MESALARWPGILGEVKMPRKCEGTNHVIQGWRSAVSMRSGEECGGSGDRVKVMEACMHQIDQTGSQRMARRDLIELAGR